MRATLAARIAWRYLFSKKSHSAVTAISVVSMCGVAIATAALVCVLSVFNGFANLLTERSDSMLPDVRVTPLQGKTIAGADSLAEVLTTIPGVEVAMPVVTDNALALYNGHETPITLMGVDEAQFRKVTAIDSLIIDGKSFSLATDPNASEGIQVWDEDLEEYVTVGGTGVQNASLSIGAVMRLSTPPLGDNVLIFAPRRIGRINLSNPAASFLTDSLRVGSVWQSQQNDLDENTVIADIAVVRRLLQYTDEATSIDVATAPDADLQHVAAQIKARLGDGVTVKDRFRQQEIDFRMIKIEKWVTFLLLAFILVVASFNLISTLSMLILEKQDAMQVMHAIGGSRRGIGAIFCWESLYVTLLGAVSGMVLGVVLCLLQQHYGFIHLNGSADTLIVTAYPVAVHFTDLLLVFAPILLIGLATALISGSFARSRITPRYV